MSYDEFSFGRSGLRWPPIATSTPIGQGPFFHPYLAPFSLAMAVIHCESALAADSIWPPRPCLARAVLGPRMIPEFSLTPCQGPGRTKDFLGGPANFLGTSE
eukprot:592838-Pyramimonas_sp.AAC.1